MMKTKIILVILLFCLGTKVFSQCTNCGIGVASPASRLDIQGCTSDNTTSSLGVNNSTPSSILFVRNDRLIGINSTSPSATLHVETASGNGGINIRTTSANPRLGFLIGSSTSTFMMGVDNADTSKFKIGTTDITASSRLTINSSGNVGIGTTNPMYTAEVSGSAAGIFNAMRLDNNQAVNVGNGSQLLFGANRSGNLMTNVAAISGIITSTGSTTATGDLVFSTANAAAPAERMRIGSDGRVGIGVTPLVAGIGFESNVGIVRIADPGSSTRILQIYPNRSSSLGDVPIGVSIYSGITTSGEGLCFLPNGGGTAGVKLSACVYDGAAWKSVWETQNESSTSIKLWLMKSEGYVAIGSTSNPASTVDDFGSFGGKVTSVTTTYTASNEVIILGDATTATFTITLPAASSVTRRVYIIKRKDSTAGHSVTVAPHGTDLIDGVNANQTLGSLGSIRLASDGTSWYLF